MKSVFCHGNSGSPCNLQFVLIFCILSGIVSKANGGRVVDAPALLPLVGTHTASDSSRIPGTAIVNPVGSRAVKAKVVCDSIHDAVGIIKAPETLEMYVYPNPFTIDLTIEFSLVKAGYVSVDLFDQQGNHIVTLHQCTAEAGPVYKLIFDSSRLKPGVYISRVTTKEQIESRVLILK